MYENNNQQNENNVPVYSPWNKENTNSTPPTYNYNVVKSKSPGKLFIILALVGTVLISGIVDSAAVLPLLVSQETADQSFPRSSVRNIATTKTSKQALPPALPRSRLRRLMPIHSMRRRLRRLVLTAWLRLQPRLLLAALSWVTTSVTVPEAALS